MRILIAHKFFRPFGGIERHLFDLRALLGRYGHEVVDFGMADPRNVPSPYAEHFVSHLDLRDASFRDTVRGLGRMLYSLEASRRIGGLVERRRPDLAHLLSVYHQLSPSILHALRRRQIPIVQKLADYKVVCPVYTLLSQGAVCDRCAHGRIYWVALRRCQGGRLGTSIALAIEAALHRWVLRSYSLVDLFLAPSRFLMDKVRAMGLPGTIRLLPNFVDVERWRPVPLPVAPVIVYSGRLVPEKGVDVLVEAMDGIPARLRILGDGPARPALERMIRARRSTNVELTGQLGDEALRAELAAARCVVLPAIWYENNPHAILEAFALGRPAIASNIGGLPELVIPGQTGLLVPPRDVARLQEAIQALVEDRALAHRLGVGARALIEASHSPEVFYQGLRAAYREVGV
jgi:glycosyltransferase involved in cell wall biosynthesis